jgi:CRP/FNR family cyclic AMP-dependent transcriptional regulator
MSQRTFSEGETVTAEGESGVGFFVIEDGNATVSIKGEVVRTLGPGDHFGEIALIDEGPRSATITAATDLRCRGMTSWEFRPFVQEHPEVAWPLLQMLASHLRASEARGEPS